MNLLKIIKNIAKIIKEKNFFYDKNFSKFSIKDYIYYKKLNYEIISLGAYCLPRVATTAAKLKPKKMYGAKTYPFDLCFHFNIKKITECIDNNFINYFDNLSYDKDNFCWVNKNIDAVYNHDTNLTKNKFIKKYEKRIKNFQKSLKTNKKIYFIYSYIWEDNFPTSLDIDNLYNALKKRRGNRKFELILIISQEIKDIKNENIHQIIINGFNIADPVWVKDFFNTENGGIIKIDKNQYYYLIIKQALKTIIKE